MLQSLDEFNRKRALALKVAREPHPNGLQCPNCENELWDSSPTTMLAVNPPRTPVHCPECGYKNTRVR